MGDRTPQSADIAGHRWVVTPFPGRAGNKYKWRLKTMFAPALAELAPSLMPILQALGADGIEDIKAGSVPNILDIDLNLDFVPRIAGALAEHVGEDKLVDTMVELMAFSTRDDRPVTPELFDEIFIGNDIELYPALWFIIKVNFSDFIALVVPRLTGSHQAKPEAATPTPTSKT